MIKISLCFIINNELLKEEIWRKWISYNSDIINIYFYYKNYKEIKSEWIKNYCLPLSFIKSTDYLHIIPTYYGLMSYSLNHDKNTQWFCFLTESCVPIIHPLEFRYLFFTHYKQSIFSWKKADWNIEFTKRANLHLLHKEYHLKNEPYFILNRENVNDCLTFMKNKKELFITISNGAVANESLFAIIFKYFNKLKNDSDNSENSDNSDRKSNKEIINKVSTITDWRKMTSPTSPFVFKNASKENIDYINQNKKKNKYSIFLRKIDNSFPDEILQEIIMDVPKYKYLYFKCGILYIFLILTKCHSFMLRYYLFIKCSLFIVSIYCFHLLFPFIITN
jgi:hypothetical protein